MRIKDHPILSFPAGETITFNYEGKEVKARKGDTIAAALHDAGVVELSRSGDRDRSRGLFCAIGKCSSCLMEVNGVPNVRTCITLAEEGMEVEKQEGFPELPGDAGPVKGRPIEHRKTELLVIGGGPGGLKAATAAARRGVEVTLVDENPQLGGQLIKQTHKFFGSSKEEAGTRGRELARNMTDQVVSNPKIDVMKNTSAVGIYDETVGIYVNRKRFLRIRPTRIVVATGATEDMITFGNNDLPGVYGAGGIQTLMNVYGVKPGDSVLMVGAGNVGLIVAYQLIQAGVEVKAVVEIKPEIGGYFVHAAKISRLGIPILTSHQVISVSGNERVNRARVAAVDETGETMSGTDKEYDVDVVALAAGLSPSYKLLHHAGCELKYQPELGGYVPIRNKDMKTTVDDIYVAGDTAGIEEATAAMLEGTITGASVALELGRGGKEERKLIAKSRDKLRDLRNPPYYEELRNGLRQVRT